MNSSSYMYVTYKIDIYIIDTYIIGTLSMEPSSVTLNSFICIEASFNMYRN